MKTKEQLQEALETYGDATENYFLTERAHLEAKEALEKTRGTYIDTIKEYYDRENKNS